MVATVTRASSARTRHKARVDEVDLTTGIDEVLNRHPGVGFAFGVVGTGREPFFHSSGLAGIASRDPVTEDTIFRIGSLTKTFTAIAVLQLLEEGLVDLDAPANDYLRAYRLVPADPRWRPATLRHLLTHTAGIPDARGLADLRHGSLTPDGGRPSIMSVPAGTSLPSLAAYYRDGLRVVVEPGTSFAYTNHGFATLGQIVEDVSGRPLARYFAERIFGPLGMADTDLVRQERRDRRLATGYAFGRTGATPVADREWIGAGAGGIYSTPRDIARFTAALLGGGANEHGRVLEPGTVATMFAPHFQPDPRIPGIGLGFFRGDLAGHLTVWHDGILPGFNTALVIAPDDGLGMFAFTNGSAGAFAWLRLELDRLMQGLLGLPAAADAQRAPHHPELWPELCGRYAFPPRISDLRQRLMLGGGAQVFVRGGRLMVRLLTPVPVLYRGLPLEPVDAGDPYVFRLDIPGAGMSPIRVVFGRDAGGGVNAAHTDLGGQPWSLVRQVPVRRAWIRPALGALAVAGAVVVARRGRSRREGRRP